MSSNRALKASPATIIPLASFTICTRTAVTTSGISSTVNKSLSLICEFTAATSNRLTEYADSFLKSSRTLQVLKNNNSHLAKVFHQFSGVPLIHFAREFLQNPQNDSNSADLWRLVPDGMSIAFISCIGWGGVVVYDRSPSRNREKDVTMRKQFQKDGDGRKNRHDHSRFQDDDSRSHHQKAQRFSGLSRDFDKGEDEDFEPASRGGSSPSVHGNPDVAFEHNPAAEAGLDATKTA